MKILHIISQRPDSTGSGIYLQALLAEAARAGHENLLIAALDNHSLPALPGVSQENCSFVHFIPAGNKRPEIIGMSDVMPYPSRIFKDLSDHEIERYLNRFRPYISGMVQQHRPDVLHTHHLWLLSSLVRQMFPDLPVITSCHGSDLRQFQQCPHLQDRVGTSCRNLDCILALTSEQQQHIASVYEVEPEKIQVCGAGFDNNLFFPDKQLNRPDNILYAGKISRAKGVPWLLKALKNVTAPFHLHIAGNGNGAEYQECLDLLRPLGAGVSLHGTIPQTTLASLMKSSKLFILPSLHEGLPLVVLEALASGCQVIATDLPGVQDIKKRVSSPNLSMIETPVIRDLDTSIIEDERKFTSNLQRAIETALAGTPAPIPQSQLNYFTWESVFRRIETAWKSVR